MKQIALWKEMCMTWPMIAPILMLFASNVFMTFAWYGQFKFPAAPLAIVIPVSWGIAFFEYCLAVPANRPDSLIVAFASGGLWRTDSRGE